MKTRYSYHRAICLITLRDGVIETGEYLVAQHDDPAGGFVTLSTAHPYRDFTLTAEEFGSLGPSLSNLIGAGGLGEFPSEISHSPSASLSPVRYG